MEQTQICGHLVAGLQVHQITRHQLLRGQPLAAAFADHFHFGAHRTGQGGNGSFGLAFLDVANGGIDQGDAPDHQRFAGLMQQQLDCPHHQERVQKWIVKLP